MRFKPFLCKSRWEALFVTSWVILIDILLVTWLTQRPVDWVSFLLFLGILLSLPLLIHLIYRTWGAFNLEYWFDRNALHIRWSATHLSIPLTSIVQVSGEGLANRRGHLLYWPAPFVRPLANRQGKPIHHLATRPLAECLLIEIPEAIVAVSPQRREFFLEALQAYNQLGPIQAVRMEYRRPLHWSTALVDTTGGWLIGLGLVGALFLFGVLMISYPALPERLIFHYNSEGMPDSIRPKTALFILPVIGTLTFLVNAAAGVWMSHRRQRVGAYLLWGGTISVQLLVLLALFSLIT